MPAKGFALRDAMPSWLPSLVGPLGKGLFLPSAMGFFIPFVKGWLLLIHFSCFWWSCFIKGSILFFNFCILWQSLHLQTGAAAAGAAFCVLLPMGPPLPSLPEIGQTPFGKELQTPFGKGLQVLELHLLV
jgi:hypothetical protein